MQKVREAERDCASTRSSRTARARSSTASSSATEYGNVIVDVGRGEAILRRDQLIQREAFRNGDRVRALHPRRAPRDRAGPQIFLSRTAPEFLAELFKMEVPEIYDGIIEIKAVARDPGSRAKMGVISYDSSIDPVGACVGMRGSPRAGGGERAAGREDRHHPVERGSGDLPRQRAAAGRGLQGGVRRRDRARSRWWCRTSSCRSPSAGAARTCGWRASSPASTSTS